MRVRYVRVGVGAGWRAELRRDPSAARFGDDRPDHSHTEPESQARRPQDVKLAPDGKLVYVADQDRAGLWEIDPASFTVVGFLPTGAGAHGLYPSRDALQPRHGGVSADGRTLWLSGRYNAEVYVIDTQTGRLRARIPVGAGPHGLCVWPQPGRYSLGRTGILR